MTPLQWNVCRPVFIPIVLIFLLQTGCLQLLIPLTTCDRNWPTSGKLIYRSTADLTGISNGTPTLSYNLWIMNGDGTGATPLTQNTLVGLPVNPPRIAAEGSRVVYFGFPDVTGATDGVAPAVNNVWTVKPDGTARTAITQNTVSGDSQYPDITSDGSRVAFQSTQSLVSSLWNQAANAAFNIFIANATGGGLTPLTFNTVAGLNSFIPSFSPNGQKIAFHSLTALNGTWDGASSVSRNIWIMNADGTGRTALTQNSAAGYNSRQPSFSPGGGWLSFYSSTDLSGAWNGTATLSNNVWVVKDDGTSLTAITRNTVAGLDSTPTYISYDNQKVLFYGKMSLTGVWNAAAEASNNLWIANIDGTGLTPLTQNTAAGLDSYAGVFSNDGTKIYFYSYMPLAGGWNGTPVNSSNAWVMNSDGTNMHPLTQNTVAGHSSDVSHLSQPSSCR